MSARPEEYYPGSRERRRVNDARPAGRDEPDLPAGQVLLVQGREIEFFGITDLARVLNRQSGTIRAWEQKGILPRSGWTKPGRDRDNRGKRRLWTRPQVTGIWRLARDLGVLDPRMRTGLRESGFPGRVAELFDHLRTEGIT